MSLDLFDLTGRVAIVTGAASGIGRAACIAMAKSGADIVLADLDQDGMYAVAREVDATGRQTLEVPTNVTSETDVQRMTSEAVRVFGKIDILVAAAGIRVRKPVLEITREEFERVIKVNLAGVFLCGKYVGRVMVEQRRGSIINLASIHGHVSNLNIPEYSASKGGVVQLTKAMALDWASYNVRVNALCPGVTRTPGTRVAWENSEKLSFIVERTPMRRIAEPEEMVGPIIFLASDASSYVTGTSLFVDGGWTAW